MRKLWAVLSPGLLSLLLSGIPAFAHHNAAGMFDMGKTISLRGAISNLDWRNPHASIALNVRNADGKITTWQIELASTATLSKAGLEKDLIDLNQSYSLEVFPAKNGSAQALGRTLTFENGKSVEIGDQPAVK